MKLVKLSAVAAAVLATSAVNADVIYSTDTNSVEFGGWLRAHVDNVDAAASNSDVDAHVTTDANINFKGTHQVNEEIKAIASFGINTGSSVDRKTVSFDDIVLKLEHATVGTFSFGDTGDSFAVTKGHVGLGNDIANYEKNGVEGKGVRFEKTVDEFKFSANYETLKEKHTAVAETKEVVAGATQGSNATTNITAASTTTHYANYAASLSYTADDYNVIVAYGTDGQDVQSVGFGGEYTLNDLTFGAHYVDFDGINELSVASGLTKHTAGAVVKTAEGNAFGAKVSYKFNDDVTVYGSYQLGSIENAEAANSDVIEEVKANLVKVGAKYTFSSNFSVEGALQNASATKGEQTEASRIHVRAQYTF